MLREPQIIAAVMLLVALMMLAHGNSAVLQANVIVACPFYLSYNVSPLYTLGDVITPTYTVYTQAECNISKLNGNFTLAHALNGTVIRSGSPVVDLVTNIPTTYILTPINSNTLKPGSYRTALSFATFGAHNSSSKQFVLISPANVLIKSFAASQSSVSIGSQITFIMNLTNDGGLASGPLHVVVAVSGPHDMTLSETAAALAPGQSELLTLVLNNVTDAAGTYDVYSYANYTRNNATVTTSIAHLQYTVTAPSHGGGTAPSGGTVVYIPQLSFTQVPLYSSFVFGSVDIANLGIKNIINLPETVTFSIPAEFANIFSLSADRMYLSSNQSLLVQMVFNSNNVKLPGRYVIPVNISAKVAGGTAVNSTQYLTYIVEKSTDNASIYSQVVFVSPNSATVTLQLAGAANTVLTNATLVTMLPSAVVTDESQIGTYGLPATVSFESGQPRITWLVPYLPPGKTATMSYTIDNPGNIGLLSSVQNLLVIASKAEATSILRVVSLQVPTFYTNSTDRVQVGILYTGTSQQPVRFSLTSAGDVSILNAMQVVNATPNKLLMRTFEVKAGNSTGTVVFNMNVDTRNASINYTLPALVLQRQQASTTTIPQHNITTGALTQYAIVAVVSAAIVIVSHFGMRARRKPRYVPDRAKELIRIREQIKRSDEYGEVP